MADNITNIEVPANEWTDIYAALAAAGVSVGDPLFIENVGAADISLAVQATQPVKKHTAFNIIKRDSPILMGNTSGDSGAWAYCNATDGLLAVSTTLPNGFTPQLKVLLADGYGNPIKSYLGADGFHSINVHLPDVHDKFVNNFFHQHTTPITTLIAEVPAGGNQNFIDVADSTGFQVGFRIHLNTTSIETTHPVILQITPLGGTTARFTLDRRIDLFHSTGDQVQRAIVDMSSQLGTLASPIEYFFGPEPGSNAVWDIQRFIFQMTHGTAGDLGTFGDLPRLTNGVFIRTRIDGVYRTLTNWKDNGDIKTDMFDVDFGTRSGGQGAYSTSGRMDLSAFGATAKLRGATNDQIEIYIQDNLTELDSFTMKAQGHVEFE